MAEGTGVAEGDDTGATVTGGIVPDTMEVGVGTGVRVGLTSGVGVAESVGLTTAVGVAGKHVQRGTPLGWS